MSDILRYPLSDLSVSLAAHGFLVARGIVKHEPLQAMVPLSERVRESWLERDPLTSEGSRAPGTETCLRHVVHPAYYEGRREQLRTLLELCAHEHIIAILRAVWGEEPVFRSTSLFFNPHTLSEEGNWHRDSQFVFADPQEERLWLEGRTMVGGDGMQVQVPLHTDDALEYVPGSHRRWDTQEEHRVRLGDGQRHCREPLPGARRLRGEVGDAIFFDPNGMHRGRYVASVPRLTLMVTFTRESAPARVDRFSYQPWFLHDDYLSGLSAHASSVYERFIAHYREHWRDQAHTIRRFHSGRRS